MADLFDGRDMASIKASILANEQEKGISDKPVPRRQRILAIIAIVFVIAVLVGIYVVAFALH